MSVTLGKTYSNGMVSMRRSVIQPQEGASLTDSLIDSGAEAFIASPMASLYRTRELEQAEIYGKPITADAARQQIKDEGLQLTVPDQGVTQEYLDILVYRKREEQRRAEVIQSAPQGAGATAARFGAGFAASMLDPLNIASAFVPVVGQAKYLKWLGQAGTFAKRTGVRAGVGAVEGTVGAAMVEPLIAYAKADEQADYDSADSLANIAFGTVFGGGLHVMGGAGADLYRKVRGATNPWDLPELKAGRDASAAIYDDINSQLLNAGRATDEAAADASIATSGFRSFADVSGVKLDDLYAEFGPRISFARDGEFAYANGPGLRTANQIADAIAGRTFDQAAYHGSPHDFDKFSLDKIGTGEGAQAYGWGLYFAENPGVAGMYHRNLAGAPAIQSMRLGALLLNDTNHFDYSPRGNSNYENVRSTLAETLMLQEENIRAAGSNEAFQKLVLKELDERIKQLEDEWPEGVEAAKKLRADLAKPGAVSIRLAKAPGGVYQVDIPDSATARMLDWDKPLSEQPESVKAGVNKLLDSSIFDPESVKAIRQYDSPGSVIYKMLAQDTKAGGQAMDAYPGAEGASKRLREAGVPGIRYLDEGSRSKPFVVAAIRKSDGATVGEKTFASRQEAEQYAADLGEKGMASSIRDESTRNLVVFDDSIVKITHKDGSPVTAAERKEFFQSNRPADITQTAEFKAWFDGSKAAVGADSKPLVVYHAGFFDEADDAVPQIGPEGFHFGTKNAAEERNYGKQVDDFIRALKVEQGEDGRWHWSSESVDSYDLNEEGFSTEAAAREDGERTATEYADSAGDGGGEPMPMTAAYISLKNPMRVQDQKADWTAAVAKAKRLGHDGIIYRNEFEDKGKDSYIVFEPTQIKSVNNGGAFNPNDPNILRQHKRGSIDLAKGRRVNITLFQKADRSTFVHETGHLFLEVMDSLASRADAPEALKADLAKAREWMGLKDGEAIGEKQHEQFARGFEAYLREGKAPTPKLTKIFERFADWLVKIYKDIRALDVTLSDDVRGVYDRIIAGYPAAKKVELAGPAKREAALKAAVAQAVTGRKVDVEGIINGDQREVMRAAKNPEQALSEPLPEPLKVEDDDTGIESARESLGEIEALIKASDDEAVIRELDDLDEIVAQAKTWGRVAKKLAPCIGRTDG